MGIDYTSAVGFGVRDPVELRESSEKEITTFSRRCADHCEKTYKRDWNHCPSCGGEIKNFGDSEFITPTFEEFFDPDGSNEDWIWENNKYSDLFHIVDFGGKPDEENFIGFILAKCDVKYTDACVINCDILTDEQIDYLQSILNKFGIKEKPKYYLLNIVS